jgi:hypothetical protein
VTLGDTRSAERSKKESSGLEDEDEEDEESEEKSTATKK